MAQGLNNLGSGIGEGIAKAISESKKMEEEQGADQVILNFAKQQGMVTPEIETEYMKGSHSAKTGIVAGLVRQFALSAQQKQVDSLEEQRKAQAEERQQRAAILKTQQENTLLASEPPTEDQRTQAQKSGYDYLFDPQKQIYTLMPMQGDSGKTGKPSDKIQMTITGPDGTPQPVLVTGNYYAKVMSNPVDFKKTYGVNQAEFSDPSKTQVGTIDPSTGDFNQDPNGDYIRYNVHKDKTSGLEVDSGRIPIKEWHSIRDRVSKASQAVGAPETANPSPTATPPRGTVKASGRVRVIDPNGKPWTIPAEQLDDALKQGYKKG